VDRDSEIVAFDFDERDPCMSEMLGEIPEIAQFLTGLGIGRRIGGKHRRRKRRTYDRRRQRLGRSRQVITPTRAIRRSRRSISDNVKALGLAAADGYLRVTAEDPDLL